MRWRLLSALVLCALAGCGAFGSGADTGPATPAPVPEVTTTDRAPVYPPGIDAAGLDNVGRLADAHQQALRNRSYTFHERYDSTVTREAGTFRLRRVETTAVADGRRYRHDLDRRRVRPNDSVQRYTQSTFGDGDDWYERRGGETVSYHQGDIRYRRDEFAGEAAFYLQRYVSPDQSWVTRLRRNDSLYYRVVGQDGTPPGLTGTESYRVTLLVAPDGLVRRFTLRYTTRIGSRTETVSYRFWYDRVGSTTVDAPDWLDGVPRTEADTSE